jgi:hypothetical protein
LPIQDTKAPKGAFVEFKLLERMVDRAGSVRLYGTPDDHGDDSSDQHTC